MSLPQIVYSEANKSGIDVYYADTGMKHRWNANLGANEIRHFCGFHWRFKSNPKSPDDPGPFRTESAAYRDAFMFLQAQLHRAAGRRPQIAAPVRRIGR